MHSVQITRDAINRAGRQCTAVVAERPGVWDLVVDVGSDESVVVRYVDRPHRDDYTALATMLAQGDFTRAFIVYTAEDQPHLSGDIETYPLSRIDELAASLARERTP